MVEENFEFIGSDMVQNEGNEQEKKLVRGIHATSKVYIK